jgi:hypothetical protein
MNTPNITPIADIVRRVAIVGALALTVLGLSVSTASAGESEKIETKRGAVGFDEYGDEIWADDTRRDGYGIRGHLRWIEGDRVVEAVVLNNFGAGSPVHWVDVEVPEGHIVWLWMCYVNKYNVEVRCGRSQRGEA